MFAHNTAGGFFANLAEAKQKNVDDKKADLYSILYDLESFRKDDGLFQLAVCFPGRPECNEWLQSSNPVLEETITGFSAISLGFTGTGRGNAWQGIGLSPIDDENLIDDEPSGDRWWTSIGTISGIRGKFPGPNPHLVTRIALFAQKLLPGITIL